jgi:hypothetical protein
MRSSERAILRDGDGIGGRGMGGCFGGCFGVREQRTHQSAGRAIFVCFLFLRGEGVGDFGRLGEGYY